MTDVTQWGVPETNCTRRYGAISAQLLKNPELVLTLSTIFGWERDYTPMNKARIRFRIYLFEVNTASAMPVFRLYFDDGIIYVLSLYQQISLNICTSLTQDSCIVRLFCSLTAWV